MVVDTYQVSYWGGLGTLAEGKLALRNGNIKGHCRSA